jgi:Protein of unknown function (DUF4231)
MSAPMRPDRLTERAVPKGEPTPEPSIRAIGPGPEGKTRGESRASAPRPAGDVSDEGDPKAELGAIIDQLELSELQKRCLRARWLDAVTWMDGKAKQTRSLYYALRLVTIIGGVIIPALVSLDLGSERAGSLVRGMTFGLSLLVAISAAIEGFFRYGERWRHYRLTVERLKIEGWQFLQLSGPYAQQRSHGAAYPEFAAQVEEILRSDVQQYITEIVREKQASAEQAGARADHPQPAPPSS